MCVNTILYNIFIKGRENDRGIDAINLNDLNIYIRDIVTIFRFFC